MRSDKIEIWENTADPIKLNWKSAINFKCYLQVHKNVLDSGTDLKE